MGNLKLDSWKLPSSLGLDLTLAGYICFGFMGASAGIGLLDAGSVQFRYWMVFAMAFLFVGMVLGKAGASYRSFVEVDDARGVVVAQRVVGGRAFGKVLARASDVVAVAVDCCLLDCDITAYLTTLVLQSGNSVTVSMDSSSGIGVVNNRAEQLALMLAVPLWRGEMAHSLSVVMVDGVPQAKYGELRYARDRLNAFLRNLLSYVIYFAVIALVVVGGVLVVGLMDMLRGG